MKKKILTKQPLTIGPGTTIEIKTPQKVIVSITESGVEIERKGMMSAMSHGLKGTKTIPFKNITNIQLKEAGLTSGYLQFGMLGSLESKGGVMRATSDENTIMFVKKDQDKIIALKNYIESKMNQEESTNQLSVADEIAKFKKLLDDGILTQEEFDKKKAELLGL